MKVTVNKTCATVSGAEMLTSGMVGKTIDAEFSADWLGLIKIAVFTNGAVTRDVLDPNGAVIIPWEVLATPNKRASVGFYGYKIENGEKVLAIPTIWAELGTIRAGADPSGDPSAELSPTVAEQLQADVNDLDERVTYIEEHGGGGGTSDYTDLNNKPKINGVELSGNKTTEQLGIEIPSLAGYATEQWVEGKGYLTEHQSLSAYRTSAAQDVIDNGKVDKVTGKGLSTNDYTDADKAKVASAVQPSDLPAPEVFTATYETTTYAEIVSAANSGKKVQCKRAQSDTTYIYDLTVVTDTVIRFGQLSNAKLLYASVNSSDEWSQGNIDYNTLARVADLTDYALKTDLDDKVDIAQGVSHSGEFLVVGSDGNVTTKTLSAWQGGSY